MSTITEPLGSPPTHLETDRPDPKRWLALAVIAVAQLMVVLDASIVTIALPSAQTLAAYLHRQPPVGHDRLHPGLRGPAAPGRPDRRLCRTQADLHRRPPRLRRFLRARGVAHNAPMLFGARALQGAFAALMAPAALSLITVTFTEAKERATAFGVYGGISGGGAAIGLILGGVLTQYASWRWCLLVNVPIAILTAVLAVPIVRESQGPRQHQLRHPRGDHRHRWTAGPGLRLHQGSREQLDGRKHTGLPGYRQWSCWHPSWSSSCGPRTRCSPCE